MQQRVPNYTTYCFKSNNPNTSATHGSLYQSFEQHIVQTLLKNYHSIQQICELSGISLQQALQLSNGKSVPIGQVEFNRLLIRYMHIHLRNNKASVTQKTRLDSKNEGGM